MSELYNYWISVAECTSSSKRVIQSTRLLSNDEVTRILDKLDRYTSQLREKQDDIVLRINQDGTQIRDDYFMSSAIYQSLCKSELYDLKPK